MIPTENVTSGTAASDSFTVATPPTILPNAASTSTRPRRRIENLTNSSNMSPESSDLGLSVRLQDHYISVSKRSGAVEGL